jgi:MipA family protein
VPSISSDLRIQPATPNRPLRTALTLLAACGAAWVGADAHAQSANTSDSPWSISVGAAVVSAPEYEGASKRATGLLPDVSIGYKTRDYGRFTLGGKGRGLSWTIVDQDAYSFGIGLSGDAGRTDSKDGTAFKPGSKRLLGMGEIKQSLEFTAFGHVTLGVPFFLQVSKGASAGQPDPVNFSTKGPGGTHIELSSEIPYEVSKSLSLSLSPTISWADTKFTQSYFGVTAAQAARTGFAEFKAKGGIRSVGVSLGANYKIDSNWSANAGASFSQLQGDASKSPLTQKKGQAQIAAGVSYKF